MKLQIDSELMLEKQTIIARKTNRSGQKATKELSEVSKAFLVDAVNTNESNSIHL